MPPRPHAPDLVHERFKLLLRELAKRDPHGETRGWQKRVGERLGLAATTISSILSDQRRVAWNVASAAAEKVKIDRRFFTDDDPTSWLALMDLEHRSDAERRADALSPSELRRRASELRRALRESPPDEQLIEGLRLAQSVLDSRAVVAARRVRAAPPDEQMQAIRALAREVADHENPVEHADTEDVPTDARAAHMRKALLGSVSLAVRDYVLHQRRDEQPIHIGELDEAIQRGRTDAAAIPDDVIDLALELGPAYPPETLTQIRTWMGRPDELPALRDAIRRAAVTSAQRKIDRETAPKTPAKKKTSQSR